MVKGGYTKKLGWVDLTKRKVRMRELDDGLLEKFIGGVGLGTKLLYDMGLSNRDPLSSESILLIMTGPLSGTFVPTSGRVALVAQSPQTKSYGESDIGGTWGPSLKKNGFDGIAIRGSSEGPVFLKIDEGRITIEDASPFWGLDTFQTSQFLMKRLGKGASVMCIGPAGERLCKIAAVFTDGVHARAAGRGGFGAVMGAKKLKAIVASKGTSDVGVYRYDQLLDSVKKSVKDVRTRTKALGDYGTAGGILFAEEVGDLPIKNWLLGSWAEGAKKISGEELNRRLFKKKYFCASCITGCGRDIEASTKYGDVRGGGPEYETLAALGANLLVDDIEAIAVGNELCNRLGVDTISCGSVIGFAMEAYEKHLITESDIGYGLNWGDAETMLQMVKDIGHCEGFGRLLGEGVKGASDSIGGNSNSFAVHVKGLEPPMHDPRACASMAIAYATNPNGATHWPAGNVLELKKVTIPELGVREAQVADRFGEEGKAELVKRMQDYVTMFNSIKMCRFLLRVNPSRILEWFYLTTGVVYDVESFLLPGERISNLKKICNLKLGFGKRDDALPERLIKEKRGTGGSAEYLPDIDRMLRDYYLARGWDEEGIPLKNKVAELGLESEMETLWE
jgi:aldehyde:ferredoxin oxidoreductase